MRLLNNKLESLEKISKTNEKYRGKNRVNTEVVVLSV
jgi:hypothetical protein